MIPNLKLHGKLRGETMPEKNIEFNREKYFQMYRGLFVPKLTQKQVDGHEAIIDYFEYNGDGDANKLAYLLATAYHETGTRMEPVREGFARSNEEAVRIVTRMYEQGKISTNYALPDKNGNSFYGRGLVQITWPDNYKRLGHAIGVGDELYENPDKALELGIAVQILIVGSMQGLFTGKKLSYYINNGNQDYLHARKVINAMDRAYDIRDYAIKFRKALIVH